MNLKDGTPLLQRFNKWEYELKPPSKIGDESMIRTHEGQLVRVRLDVAEDGSLWLVQVGLAVQCPPTDPLSPLNRVAVLQDPLRFGGYHLQPANVDDDGQVVPVSVDRNARLIGVIRLLEDLQRRGGLDTYDQHRCRVQADVLRSMLRR